MLKICVYYTHIFKVHAIGKLALGARQPFLCIVSLILCPLYSVECSTVFGIIKVHVVHVHCNYNIQCTMYNVHVMYYLHSVHVIT